MLRFLNKTSNILMALLMLLLLFVGYYVFQENKLFGLLILVFPLVYFTQIVLYFLVTEESKYFFNKKAFNGSNKKKKLISMHYPVIKLPATKRKELEKELEDLLILKQNAAEHSFLNRNYLDKLDERIARVQLQLDEDLLIDLNSEKRS